MRKIRIRRSFLYISVVMVLSTTGCIKETYDMNKLSKEAHLSPTMAITAIKGDISLSDMVKSNDTVVFDQNNFVRIIFRKDSVIDLAMPDFLVMKNMIGLNGNNKVQPESKLLNPVFDFAKGFDQLIATIKPDTLNFDIGDILSHITGEFQLSNPSIKLYYSNSFALPVKIKFDAIGKKKDKTVNLDLDTFALSLTNSPDQQGILDSLTIDKNNSSLRELLSLLPEEISFFGSAMLDSSGNKNQINNYILGNSRILGSLEVEVPLEFRTNNLQFTDTVDNFLKDDGSGNDSPVKPENFELLRVDINAKNGFPLGVSLKMSLYDSVSDSVKNTVDATGILELAPVDIDGKVKPGEVTETSTSFEFTKVFFSSINKADKIIFQFSLNTTDEGSKDVKIYSDYRIDFNAALVVKPDINFK
ncbi:MAG: hypothetical protein NTV31_01855 [Bacteroidia bacterium]|nr:hypothetical protein [Bacteroidia bacterium]